MSADEDLLSVVVRHLAQASSSSPAGIVRRWASGYLRPEVFISGWAKFDDDETIAPFTDAVRELMLDGTIRNAAAGVRARDRRGDGEEGWVRRRSTTLRRSPRHAVRDRIRRTLEAIRRRGRAPGLHVGGAPRYRVWQVHGLRPRDELMDAFLIPYGPDTSLDLSLVDRWTAAMLASVEGALRRPASSPTSRACCSSGAACSTSPRCSSTPRTIARRGTRTTPTRAWWGRWRCTPHQHPAWTADTLDWNDHAQRQRLGRLRRPPTASSRRASGIWRDRCVAQAARAAAHPRRGGRPGPARVAARADRGRAAAVASSATAFVAGHASPATASSTTTARRVLPSGPRCAGRSAGEAICAHNAEQLLELPDSPPRAERLEVEATAAASLTVRLVPAPQASATRIPAVGARENNVWPRQACPGCFVMGGESRRSGGRRADRSAVAAPRRCSPSLRRRTDQPSASTEPSRPGDRSCAESARPLQDVPSLARRPRPPGMHRLVAAAQVIEGDVGDRGRRGVRGGFRRQHGLHRHVPGQQAKPLLGRRAQIPVRLIQPAIAWTM